MLDSQKLIIYLSTAVKMFLDIGDHPTNCHGDGHTEEEMAEAD